MVIRLIPALIALTSAFAGSGALAVSGSGSQAAAGGTQAAAGGTQAASGRTQTASGRTRTDANGSGLAGIDHTNSVLVNRKQRFMQVVDSKGKVVLESPVGIGRGGIRRKRSMADDVTPTGTFHVDVILSNDSKKSRISASARERFALRNEFAPYLNDGRGLTRLFGNMNSIDFNKDGKPDRAYGSLYIGLDGKGTGPKIARYGNVIRWFSIALHGTPDESAAIGKATSGGCVHLQETDLRRLIDDKLVRIGTKVVITDGGK